MNKPDRDPEMWALRQTKWVRCPAGEIFLGDRKVIDSTPEKEGHDPPKDDIRPYPGPLDSHLKAGEAMTEGWDQVYKEEAEESEND